MKKTAIFAALLLAQSLLCAQETVRFYPEMCDELQMVFCDYAQREGTVAYLSGADGEFLGNMINHKIYGWGCFVSKSGSQTYGQYREGQHIFGITLTSETARVGGEEHFVEYDLSTGNIMRVHTPDGEQRLSSPYIPTDEAPVPAYTFKILKYPNGDEYRGELLNGRRHGYGIYFWANGDRWYGRYENGYRQGCGVLIKADRRLFSGKWVGDTKVW